MSSVPQSRRSEIIKAAICLAGTNVIGRSIPYKAWSASRAKLNEKQKEEFAKVFEKYSQTKVGEEFVKILKMINPPILLDDITESDANELKHWEEMETKFRFTMNGPRDEKLHFLQTYILEENFGDTSSTSSGE